MIVYSTLGTNDMDCSIALYDAVLGALGATREVITATRTRYGRSGERAKVCLTRYQLHRSNASTCVPSGITPVN